MKKLVLTFAAVAIMGVCCAQPRTLQSESKKAANQAAAGNLSGAANTASKTWQNDDMPKGSTPGLYDAVANKVKEAEKQKTATTGSSSGSSSGSNTDKKKTSTPSKK